MSRRLRVLLVEPHHGGSHGAWAEGLVRHSAHEVRVIGHPDRHWRWRLRGSAVTLAERAGAEVARWGRPDVVVVSGLTDLASFCGLSRRWLGATPVALYLHESQLLHPPSPNGAHGADVVFAQWRSMVAADHVFVGSEHHRRALFEALPAALAAVPDEPHTHLLDGVAARPPVLPVGVELRALLDGERAAPDGGPPLVVWPHRWDHDKRPEAFLRVVVALARAGVPFRVALAGANTRSDPQEFDRAVAELGERVVHVGHLPRPGYEALLLRSDVVVSTAAHEFFGVAVVEAMAAGVVPLLPDRLAYPELVPAPLRPAVLYRHSLFDRLRAVLEDLPAARQAVGDLRRAMARHAWEQRAPDYDEALAVLADRGVAPAGSGGPRR